MDQNLKVTIGIPVYNGEKFLSLAISSVLRQSFPNFELIISDDGSNDRTIEIAKSFSDPRIILQSDGINRGISSRLNEQIKLAKGKYFARMDADDIMLPDRIEKQFHFLQNNPGIDVVGSYAVVIDDENNILGLRKSSIPYYMEGCYKTVPFIHPTVMGKIEWFIKFQYSEEMNGVEDVDLWLRAFNTSIFYIMPEPLLVYRDPLKIKFKTYKGRTYQLLKLYKQNMYNIGNHYYYYYLKLTSFLKLIIYWIFKFIRVETVLIRKRNSKLNKEEIHHIRNEIILLTNH